MTHTESMMRHMRIVLDMFRKTGDFDEQWVHCRSFLDTLHSIVDTNTEAYKALSEYEVIRYGVVLRNIFHHQPLTAFGKHAVIPASMTFNFKVGEPFKATVKLALVISNEMLARPEVRDQLRKSSRPILTEMLAKLRGNDVPVERLMVGIMDVVERHCRETGQYDERADRPARGFTLRPGKPRSSSG